jgi:hypothetical protein
MVGDVAGEWFRFDPPALDSAHIGARFAEAIAA